MGAARYMRFILRVARARNALTGDNVHINTCEAAVIQKGWAGVFVLLVLMFLFFVNQMRYELHTHNHHIVMHHSCHEKATGSIIRIIGNH